MDRWQATIAGCPYYCNTTEETIERRDCYRVFVFVRALKLWTERIGIVMARHVPQAPDLLSLSVTIL